jgi:adenylate cyclase
MADESFKRKLTAILSADVAGYSRLMADDETATVKTIASYRVIMASLIKQHRGRVVDSPGDNLLAEFSSVVDAVQCAVAVQNEIQTRNAELSDDRKMKFRIGINLGDIIDEENRIYGDGVNIAARLEAMADPGGICVSKTAFDHIRTKLPLGYEYLGEQSVKNIPMPVGAYRVLMTPDAAGQVIGEKRFLGRFSRKAALATIIILVVVAGGLVGWNIYLQQSKKVEPASTENMAFPLPDKPSIAVLPFTDMSDGPKQEYFSDGITEEIITALSKVPKLFVIARNSTFTYKSNPVTVQQVAENLGIRYVLEGSIRKDENKVRITAQLIDALTGHHLWAERYDRDLKDIFALQDEITKNIITAMQVKLTEGEQALMWGKGTNSLDAYLKYLEGRDALYRSNAEANVLARRKFEEAIALDPEYPVPYYFLGWTHLMDIFYGRAKSREKSLKLVAEYANKTLALDGSFTQSHLLLGQLYMFNREYEKAIAEGEQAITSAPNWDGGYAIMATFLFNSGRPEEAITMINKAIRLNPIPPAWYYRSLGISYFLARHYEEAIAACEKALNRNPDELLSHLFIAAAYSVSGREKEASTAVSRVLRLNPKFSLKVIYNRPFKRKTDIELLANALRKAGLPEHPPPK